MYKLISLIERGTKGVRIVCKLAYYKVKYGKRLKVGKGVHFRKGFIINISEDGFLSIGDNTRFNNNCSINCRNKIIIGKGNFFGEGVKIYDHNHVFNIKGEGLDKGFKTRSITIGDRNWFGSNVVILSKARIGNNNVFAAGLVVNSEFDSDNIVTLGAKQEKTKIIYRENKK